MKRKPPSPEILSARALRLRAFQQAGPMPESGMEPVGLEQGNKKTGQTGRFYSKIFVWNIPPVNTCPGATPKCLASCYNGDPRPEIFPVDKWQHNLWWFVNHTDRLQSRIQQQLDDSPPSTAVRIHSSGDFFSRAYIQFWARLILDNRAIQFWAYTRSWRVEQLLEDLEALRQLPNLQLFASVDDSIDNWPKDWRLSILRDNQNATPSNALVCPEQTGKIANCASCGFCLKKNPRSIIFDLY